MSKDGWQSMKTAPQDGSLVWARRVHNGYLVKEGWAVWGINSKDAPMRQWGPGGLDGRIPPDHAYADTPRWLVADRRYSFPEPTSWHPEMTRVNKHIAAA